MATFAVDGIQGTVGVALQNRAPTDNSGNVIGAVGDWVKEAASTQNVTIRSGGDKASLSNAGKAVYTFRGEQGGTQNYEVVFYVQNAGATTATAIARHDPSVATYYEAGYVVVSGSGKWQIAKIVAGVGRTLLAEATVGTDWAFGEWMKLIFVCTDDEKTLRLEANSGGKADKIALTDSANDNTITAEGYTGFTFDGEADRMRLISFQAETLSSEETLYEVTETETLFLLDNSLREIDDAAIEHEVTVTDKLWFNEIRRVVFIEDDFTDIDGTLITAHVPNIGGPISFVSTTVDEAIISQNEVKGPVGSTSLGSAEYIYAKEPDTPYYAVNGICAISEPVGGDNFVSGLVARFTTGQFKGYWLNLILIPNEFSGNLILQLATGDGTVLDSHTFGPFVNFIGVDFPLRLECAGSNLRGYFQTVLVVSAVDTTFPDAGKAGFVLGSYTGDAQINDFSVEAIDPEILAQTYNVIETDKLLTLDPQVKEQSHQQQTKLLLNDNAETLVGAKEHVITVSDGLVMLDPQTKHQAHEQKDVLLVETQLDKTLLLAFADKLLFKTSSHKTIDRSITNHLLLNSASLRGIEKALQDQLLFKDVVIARREFELVLLDKLLLGITNIRALEKSLSDNLLLKSINDQITTAIRKHLITASDSLFIFDELSKLFLNQQTDSILLSSNPFREQLLSVLNNLATSDSVIRAIAKVQQTQLIINSLTAFGLSITESDQMLLESRRQKAIDKVLFERIFLDDSISLAFELLLEEGLLLSDETSNRQIVEVVLAALVFANLNMVDLLGAEIGVTDPVSIDLGATGYAH